MQGDETVDTGQSTLPLYHDAVACLAYASHESQKTVNVDITMMLTNMQQCSKLVDKLRTVEQDTIRLAALDQLVVTLEHLKEVLRTKIDQLDNLHETRIKDDGLNQKSHFDAHGQGRRQAICDTLMPKGNVTFADVAGLEDAKETLKEAIIMPIKYPHLFTGGRKPWKRILLYGPPGTGKTRLAQALSNEIKSSFYSVSSSDLISSWVGESEKLIKELFVHATKQDGRSIIFIDEIDSICRKRSSAEEEHTRRVKTELLRQMEGVDTTENSEKIFLLCATNCPWELDSAFLRRFQKRIYIPLPDYKSRLQLIQIHTKENHVTLGDGEWKALGDATVDYSGSDLSTVVLGALFEPIRELQQAVHWHPTIDGNFTPCCADAEGAFTGSMHDLPPAQIHPRNVNLQDFLRSLNTNRRTVSVEELRKFEEFTASFGENG